MEFVDTAGSKVTRGTGGADAPVIYIIDSPEHPLDEEILSQRRESTIASVPVRNWNDALTPWPASGVYRGEPDFGGKASATLAELLERTIPAIEAAQDLSPSARSICGYSLGGLFALVRRRVERGWKGR